MCLIDDVGPADITAVTDPTARKPHQCGECYRTINPGETYRRWRWLYDGRFVSVKQCAHCRAAGVWLDEVCRGYLIGSIAEELESHWDKYGGLALGRLVVGISRRWSGITVDQVTAAVDSCPMVAEINAAA